MATTRRDFMSKTAAGTVGLGGMLRPGLGQTAEPLAAAERLAVINANVYTMNPQQPRAEGLFVLDGRILRVGDSSAIRREAGRGAQVMDVRGMTITPGFIDCHNHAPGNTLLYEVLVGNPYVVEFVTIASIVAKLRARAATTPPGFWVEGFFFDDTKVSDKRELNVHDLDQVSTQHPVVVHHRGGHTGYYNSRALELAGVTLATPNPSGGTFDRDQDGALNGRVTDRARAVFFHVGQRPSYTEAQWLQRDREGLAYISKQFVRYGLTTVHHEGGDLRALQEVRASGNLLHRVSYEASGAALEAMITGEIQSGFGDEWLRFGATSEHTVDGSFSERTMALSVPYAGSQPPYYGNLTESQDDLNAWVERVHRAGIQVNCHANGDVAIDRYLTALERAQQLFPRADARPKITHCTLINPNLLRRIAALGAVPALFNTYAYYNSDKFHFYGEAMMEHAMAFRSLLDAGVHAAGGSDFDPGPFDPRMAIQGMVTRTGWNGETWGANQRVSLDEAIRINTWNGAYNAHEEAIKGSIAPGKLADFVVLAEDPHSVAVDKIKDIDIARTVVGGATVYQA